MGNKRELKRLCYMEALEDNVVGVEMILNRFNQIDNQKGVFDNISNNIGNLNTNAYKSVRFEQIFIRHDFLLKVRRSKIFLCDVFRSSRGKFGFLLFLPAGADR